MCFTRPRIRRLRICDDPTFSLLPCSLDMKASGVPHRVKDPQHIKPFSSSLTPFRLSHQPRPKLHTLRKKHRAPARNRTIWTTRMARPHIFRSSARIQAYIARIIAHRGDFFNRTKACMVDQFPFSTCTPAPGCSSLARMQIQRRVEH